MNRKIVFPERVINQRIMKITYHIIGDKKMNAYLKMPSPTFQVLKKEIELCLFEERKQPHCEIRTFWIDEDNDEIEIVNQCDYEIFMNKNYERLHLQVAPIDMDVELPAAAAVTTQASVTSTDSASNETNTRTAGSYYSAVHDRVECDHCLMSPIMGFRYKCIQCPNFDLCENCESKHIHSEHMMVRMPTNNCPNVIEAYVTGRNSGRRHGKRSKTSCPFVKNGLSLVIDDDGETPKSAGGENVEQSSPVNGKERHHGRKHHRRIQRNNFFSHLYEMMHDLAEGGGDTAAAHAMGESSCKSATDDNGQQTNSSTPEETPIVAATIAQMAAQQAHGATAIAAEIAAKVAHETALKTAKNISENITSSFASTSSAETDGEKKEKAATKEKVDATTTPRDAESKFNDVPITVSPSLESLAQFLDPQYVKTGIQILNNFSDMFAKMLDPMVENTESDQNQNKTNFPRNSANSSISSNHNSFGSEKKSNEAKSVDKDASQDKVMESSATSIASANVELADLGSDSENDSVSESFVKLNVPTPLSTKSTTVASTADNTPPKSLEKSNALDFAQLSENLKIHIAEESAKNSYETNENASESIDNTAIEVSTANVNESSVTTTTSTSTTTLNSTTPSKPEEKRAVVVYHADQRINNAVNAMMAMGFSNEGAWLTQLLESVNGNIPEALDVMSAAQRNASR